MTSYDFDLITIGAGSGGVRASRTSAGLGARVAIIENFRTGGTCVMRGCVPKKLLVYGSEFSEHFIDAVGYGWSLQKYEFDWKTLIDAKNRELTRLEKAYQKTLDTAGVTQIEGKGTILDSHTVKVGEATWTGEHILIATGGWPTLPNIPGIEYAITSNEALDLEALPNSIVIVGGGYIALEFAGIFNSFGTNVTIIIRAKEVLRGFDFSIRESLGEELSKKGIQTLNETNIISIKKGDKDALELTLESGEVIKTEVIMFATGRQPNTEGLGLENAEIATDGAGAIRVDKYSQTSSQNIYAIGDVTNRVNLTPVALAEGMALAKTLFGGTPTPMNYSNIPSAVFCQPPIACVGLTEEKAKEHGPFDVYFSSFRPMKHTISKRDEISVMKVIVDRQTNKVIGCHMLGRDAPEIIQGLAIAIKCGATKADFDSTVGIHPTSAEEFVTMREKL